MTSGRLAAAPYRFRARTNEAGVTLIEMLAAVTLVAFIATGMVMVLRVALDGQAKAQGRIASLRKVIGVERIMREQVANLAPVNTLCRAATTGAGSPEILFEGKPHEMRFVTTYTLNEAARSLPRMIEYIVIPGVAHGVRLVMNEVPYGGPRWLVPVCVGYAESSVNQQMVPQFRPITVTGNSFVLADELASCRFVYRDDHDPKVGPQWVPVWTIKQWPGAVRIELIPYAPNPALLQPSSITIPLPADPKPGVEYHD